MQQSDRNAHSDHINHRAPDTQLNRSPAGTMQRAPSTSSRRYPQGISFSPEGNKMQNLQRAVNKHVDGGTLTIYHAGGGSMAFFGHAAQKNESFHMDRGMG